jgi:hypothetical protein
LRTFTDIDILVASADRERAAKIMAELGFELLEPEYRKGEDYLEDKWCLKTNPRVLVEIHTDLVHNPSLRRLSSVTYDDVLSAGNGDWEDATALLLVASAHAAVSHQFDRLQHILDVALAASGAAGPVDIARLKRAAPTSGVTTGLHVGLSLAGRMFRQEQLLELANAVSSTPLAAFAGRLLTQDAVMTARSKKRGGFSWRRKVLRQIIR